MEIIGYSHQIKCIDLKYENRFKTNKEKKMGYLDTISWVLISYVGNRHRIYSRNKDIKKIIIH